MTHVIVNTSYTITHSTLSSLSTYYCYHHLQHYQNEHHYHHYHYHNHITPSITIPTTNTSSKPQLSPSPPAPPPPSVNTTNSFTRVLLIGSPNSQLNPFQTDIHLTLKKSVPLSFEDSKIYRFFSKKKILSVDKNIKYLKIQKYKPFHIKMSLCFIVNQFILITIFAPVLCRPESLDNSFTDWENSL